MKKGFIGIAGICGFLVPISMIITLALAVSNSPNFSISQNWFSDLAGTVMPEGPFAPRPNAGTATTALIFNTGIIITGILALIFAFGLRRSLKIFGPPGQFAALAFIISAIGAIGVGIFPEPAGLPHTVAGMLYFTFAAIGTFYISAILMGCKPIQRVNAKQLGYFLFILGLITLSALTFYMRVLELQTMIYFRATVQIISMIAIWLTIIFLSDMMFRFAPRGIPFR